MGFAGAPSGGAGVFGAAGAVGSGGATSGGNGLSCEVNRILQNNCMTCHGVQPALSLLSSRDALLKQSTEQPNLRVIDVALSRIQQTAALPMPPAPAARLPASDVAIISQWVSSGAPAETCGSMGAGGSGSGGSAGASGAGGASGSGGSGGSGGAVTNPYTIVCTSMKTWSGGNGQDMRPGNDCTSCHSFKIAGTVYPTAHEPNNCDGTATGGVKVLITGADGATLTLTPSGTSGSFYSNSSVKAPYSVKLTDSAGRTRQMVAHQSAGNCNNCHSPDGSNGAPGRIMAP